jgi:N-acetylmuramoyl-L-alanine amidase
MKLLAAVAITATILGAAQSSHAQLHAVTAVRHWSLPDTTRIAIEVSGDFQYRTERLHNPERVYYDILNARPHFEGKRLFRESFEKDKLVTGIRVAETTPGVTRVVLDLSGPVEATASQLSTPDRLIIELRPGAPPPVTAPAPATVAPAPVPAALPPATAPVAAPAATALATKPAAVPVETATTTPGLPAVKPDTAKPDPAATEISKAARHTSSGNTSLVRALGLKIGRVVIDAGHGGHDQGTAGPKGLLEKDVVLDVALRVGKLIEDRLGAEVIYTRSDDTFIPLERRTEIANEKKADLFLSIHANSSSIPRIAGVETYYLNLPDQHDQDATDTAARENASSQKSVFELQDLVKKITLNDKLEESREFAARVQASLYTFSARNVPNSRNRGVRRAPFVVLIGAHMPSILAEIGFLTNPREEALLRRPEYRQKLAEALFRGVQRYAEGLSHFQVAKAGEEE